MVFQRPRPALDEVEVKDEAGSQRLCKECRVTSLECVNKGESSKSINHERE